jgi:hypothetical protein
MTNDHEQRADAMARFYQNWEATKPPPISAPRQPPVLVDHNWRRELDELHELERVCGSLAVDVVQVFDGTKFDANRANRRIKLLGKHARRLIDAARELLIPAREVKRFALPDGRVRLVYSDGRLFTTNEPDTGKGFLVGTWSDCHEYEVIRWHRVEDGLPAQNQYVMVASKHGALVGIQFRDGAWLGSNGVRIAFPPTHWAPYPKGPRQ